MSKKTNKQKILETANQILVSAFMDKVFINEFIKASNRKRLHLWAEALRKVADIIEGKR